MATLTIGRDAARWVDRARAYMIVIDGETGGTIDHGATVTLDLTPGPHRVRMMIDWCGSKELEISGDSDVVLRCWAAASPFTAELYVYFRPNRYIGLEIEAPERRG